jgi:hypothetical protein
MREYVRVLTVCGGASLPFSFWGMHLCRASFVRGQFSEVAAKIATVTHHNGLSVIPNTYSGMVVWYDG